VLSFDRENWKVTMRGCVLTPHRSFISARCARCPSLSMSALASVRSCGTHSAANGTQCRHRRGETFSLETHEQGTEVKAITYSAMQVIEKPDDVEIFVIVDI
jgi:hypothetical protein